MNLFNSAAELTPRLSVGGVVIAQTNSIVDTKNNETLWPPPSGSSTCPTKPPTECAFYGDFGMALKTGKNDSVDSLVRQPSFWAACDQTLITPGYRVHAPVEGRPWGQFGLGADDLAAQAGPFQLDLKTGLVSEGLTVSSGAITFPVVSPQPPRCCLTPEPSPRFTPRRAQTPPPPTPQISRGSSPSARGARASAMGPRWW